MARTSNRFQIQLVAASIAVGNLLFSTHGHSAEPACAPSFRNLGFSEIDLKSPALSKFISSRAIERLHKTQSPSFRKVEDSISSVETGKGHVDLSVRNSDIYADVGVEKTGDSLTISIDYVALVNANSVKNNKGLDLGKTNPALNLGFPRLLTAVAAGINRQVGRDPSIRKVILEGKFVMNQKLAEQLKEFGFESEVTKGAIFMAPKKGVAGNAAAFMAPVQALLTTFPVDIPHGKVIKGASAAAGKALKIKSAYQNNLVGRDWRLVFELEEPNLAEAATAIAE